MRNRRKLIRRAGPSTAHQGQFQTCRGRGGACRRALSQTGERVGVFILACLSTVGKGCPRRAQRPRPSQLSAHETKGTLVPRTVLWQRDPCSSCLSSCRLLLWGLWWDKADPFLLYSILPSLLLSFPFSPYSPKSNLLNSGLMRLGFGFAFFI